jgi:hypothetical protein
MDLSMPVFAKYLQEGTIFKSGVDLAAFRSMLDAKKQADAARRRAMAERIDVFQDDTLKIVKRKIRQQYEMENQVEIFKTLDISNNLLKRIIRDTSTIYDGPPRWDLAKDDGGAWAAIRESAAYDLVLPLVNQFTNLCNECFVRVAVDRGEVDFQVITPDNMMVEQDPRHPTQISAIWIWCGNQDTQNDGGYWHYWDRNETNPQHHVFDEGFELVDRKFKVDGVNPYKDENGRPVIPGVMFHRAYPVNRVFDDTTGNDLVDGTAMLMAMESLLNHLYRVDSAAIKYVIGSPDEEAMAGQVAGAMRLLILRSMSGEDVAAGQFRSQADWKGLRTVLTDKAQNVLNNHGLSLQADQVSGNPSSGFALKCQREPLLELRKKQLPLFRRADRELYAVTAAVWNLERSRATDESEVGTPGYGKKLLWPNEAKPQITYSEFTVPLTAAERQAELTNMQIELGMGLANILDVFMKDHPGVSRADAEKQLQENLELNKKYAPSAEIVAGRVAELSKPSSSPMSGAGPTAQPEKPKAPPSAEKG